MMKETVVRYNMKKGLIVKSPYIDDILKGIKLWEVRGSPTKIRGEIILIKSGTGHAYGTVDIVDCIELDLEKYNNWDYRLLNNKGITDILPYKRTYAYILENPKLYNIPKPYKHPNGAIIWVNLPDDF